jgi:hypothetical protein
MRASGMVVTDESAEVLGFDNSVDLATWNDTPGRTHAEVLARLDAAISKLKSEQAVQS